jgi:signal transduction histidine kinase
MAVSSQASARGDPEAGGRFGYRWYLWLVTCLWGILVAAGLRAEVHGVASHAMELFPWVGLMALLNLLPVRVWRATNLAADLPVAIAAGLTLTPLEVGLIGFLGAFDIKEFRGKITPSKALFNRSQVALADAIASWIVHQISPVPSASRFMLALAFIMLAVILVANYLLVSLALRIEFGYRLRDVIRRLRLGTSSDFTLTLAAWSVLGAMLAALYEQIGSVALVGFIFPALLARETLSRSQMYVDQSRAYRNNQEVFHHLSTRIQAERTDERRLIAADLHDEVLQPLFKVTLLGHVLKTDLATGRLLAMDQDLPDMLTAAEVAAGALRDLIGDLRRSTLGRGGVSTALRSLVAAIARESTVIVYPEIGDVEADQVTELAVYQIAKEALGNAISHSRAKNVWVALAQRSGTLVMSVRDDGVGFDPYTETQGHYGLPTMRERAQMVGGFLTIDSSPGSGCTVTLTIGGDSTRFQSKPPSQNSHRNSSG